MDVQTLLEYKRAGLGEVRKRGSVCFVNGTSLLHLCGTNGPVYARSTAKPLHLKVFAKDLDAVLTWEEKAISVSSHSAETAHIHILQKFLSPTEWESMQVPPSFPMGGRREHKEQEKIFHPCSGEHSGLIRGCILKKWDLHNYTSPRHPFHEGFVAYIRSVLGPSWHAEYVGKDGCGLPTTSFLMSELALLYANLAREKDGDWIWEAMTRNPEIVGGSERLDTAILKLGKGSLLAKEGADGLLGISVLSPEYSEGLGIVIKLEHGSDPQAMWFLARSILASLGWELPLGPQLFRQEAAVNPAIVPEFLRSKIQDLPTRDTRKALDDRF